MFTIIIFYLAISVISACVLAYFMKSAPVGWEDENGFHRGNKEFNGVKPENFKEAI